MARPLRIEFEGALYHVTSRGGRRDDIVVDDDDRRVWLETLDHVCTRFNWLCHGWCLMDNHYHLIIETPDANLSRGMRQLNGVYTQRFNRRHQQVGHLFQGRYKAILVDGDAYLLELARYVVLNPVRAGMVDDVADWPWSSYAATIGKEKSPDWLEVDWLLSCFGKQRKRAIQKYIDFVHAGIGAPSPWQHLRHQIYLGDDDFIEEIGQSLAADDVSIEEVSRAQKRPLAKPLDWYLEQSPDRNTAMAQAYRSGHYTMKEIADWFGVHYSTVSRAVKSAEGDA